MAVRQPVEEPDEEQIVVAAPIKKSVKVSYPFLVSHEGTAYYPGQVAVVPEAVAAHWILNGWVVENAAS